MEVKASLKYLRIAPRKVRLVANLLKGLSVAQAEAQLKFLAKRSARHLEKLLHSAVANATHNFNLEKENLYIANIRVDQGPSLIRYMYRARGAVYQIRKRSSHVTLILKDKGAATERKTIFKKKIEENKPVSSEKAKKVQKNKKQLKTKEVLAKEKKVKRSQRVMSKVLPKHTIFRRKSI